MNFHWKAPNSGWLVFLFIFRMFFPRGRARCLFEFNLLNFSFKLCSHRFFFFVFLLAGSFASAWVLWREMIQVRWIDVCLELFGEARNAYSACCLWRVILCVIAAFVVRRLQKQNMHWRAMHSHRRLRRYLWGNTSSHLTREIAYSFRRQFATVGSEFVLKVFASFILKLFFNFKNTRPEFADTLVDLNNRKIQRRILDIQMQ